jgi:hypothetical protein
LVWNSFSIKGGDVIHIHQFLYTIHITLVQELEVVNCSYNDVSTVKFLFMQNE